MADIPSPGFKPPLGPIQVIPQGLLGFLQLKQLGRLPDVLQSFVQPTIDLRDWYFASRRLDELTLISGGTIQTTAVTTGAGQGIYAFSAGGLAVQVPTQTMWWVEQLTVHATTPAAADTVRFSACIANPSLATFELLGPDYNDVATANVRQCMARMDRPFFAGPGDRFAVFVESVTSVAGFIFNLKLRATALPL